MPGRISLKLGASDRGDFELFQTSPSDPEIIVLPRVGIGLNQVRYENGGWSDLFDCRNIDPNFRKQSGYATYKVVKPARVQVSGDSVNIIEKGILEFTG